MTRVALITHEFPSSAHPYIAEWAKQLYQQGIDLTILTETMPVSVPYDELFEDTDLPKRVRKLASIHDRIWPVKLANRALQSWKAFIVATRVLHQEHPGNFRRLCRKLYEYSSFWGEPFDIVHFNAPQIAIRRFELGKLLGGKTLVSFRGQDFTFYPDRYDRLLREADHLHFISEHLVYEARKRGYDGSKHSLIPPMVDTDFYHQLPRGEEKPTAHPFTLFTAARFSWTKGWEYTLQAVALLVKKGFDIHYYIAGDGDFRDAVLYTVHELGLCERVHLLGWLSPAEIRDWLRQADLYILGSVNEGFNNSVLQAQACGLPVVCSDAGGLPENIVDGETGLLAHRRDAWDLADTIEMLLTDPERRIQMGERGNQRVVREFSLQQRAKEFEALYNSIASRQRSC